MNFFAVCMCLCGVYVPVIMYVQSCLCVYVLCMCEHVVWKPEAYLIFF